MTNVTLLEYANNANFINKSHIESESGLEITRTGSFIEVNALFRVIGLETNKSTSLYFREYENNGDGKHGVAT